MPRGKRAKDQSPRAPNKKKKPKRPPQGFPEDLVGSDNECEPGFDNIGRKTS